MPVELYGPTLIGAIALAFAAGVAVGMLLCVAALVRLVREYNDRRSA